jgi:pimeloyl-ACP methyl ester carboxylesterase
MNGTKAFALASVPAVAGLAWRWHRLNVRAIDAHTIRAPIIPGLRRQLTTPWGSIAYRWVPGDPSRPALVLVHGWGRTSDSAWWPVIAGCRRTMVVVDLPGHGRSQLDEPFSFELAAEAVHGAVIHAGLKRPVLVGHSMGGPVALTTVRRTGPAMFSGLVALATSAYWVRPQLRLMVAMAPYAMAPRSPFLIRTERAELRLAPHIAGHIVWAYTRRPNRQLLGETAAALRRFDARRWPDLALPPTTWVIATRDGVLGATHQSASARHFGARVVELEAGHSMVIELPEAVIRSLEDCEHSPGNTGGSIPLRSDGKTATSERAQ